MVVAVTHMHGPRPPPLSEDLPGVLRECLHPDDGVIVPGAGRAQGKHRVEPKLGIITKHFDDELAEASRLFSSFKSVEIQRV